MPPAQARLLQTFLSRSRCLALARGATLPAESHGACMFADISGFTPLTEALRSNLGARQSAEVLTSLLNQVFERLIGQIHAHCGDVLGFAGDALSVFFEASNAKPDLSPVLALHCAAAMQTEMKHFAAVPTPDGQVHTLSMKIGLSYGSVRRLLAGLPEHGQFDLLVGDSLARMAAAEHHAERGEILCAPEYQVLLSELAVWGPARDGYLPLVFCNALPPSPLSEPDIPNLSPEVLRPYFPPDLFASLSAASEGFLAELRPVVSAFVNFEGLDYVNDPAAGEKLNAYVGLVQRLANQYAGSLIRLDYGDKGSTLHVVFGAPLAYEDDEAHGVGWALNLQAEARQMPFITTQRIGMARGQVYAGALGASTRRGYTLMGDEVNASARLMQACQPGQTLVSQSIMLAAQKRYMFHPFPGFQVKGKYEPVPVAMPVAPLPAMPQMPSAPLVGREAELARLNEALDALLAGTGQLLRIEGGAGVGKSRLTAELLQRAMLHGVRALFGSGQSVGQGTLYLAWREVMRSLFGLQSAWPAMQQAMQMQNMLQWINPEWTPRLPLLGDLLGLEIPDTPLTAGLNANLRQQSLFALLGDLLGRMALQQPLLILIEDCHWLDQASAALFESLALGLAQARVFLVATHRPPLDPDHPILPGLDNLRHCQRLCLAELTPEAARLLVTTRLGGELPEALMALIIERAQGNPLFVEELAETLRETSRLKMENGRWVLDHAGGLPPLPDTVQKVVLARLDRLAETERLTLKVSSVAGRRFPVDLVEGVHPARPAREHLEAQLAGLEKRDFVQPEQLAPEQIDQFKHNITHEVAYETLLYAQRRDLHRAAAGWIEATYAGSLSSYYAALVYHYQRAEHPERQRHYARLAGLQAAARYANTEAIAYLSLALELTSPENLALQYELLLAREKVYDLQGRRQEQFQDIEALRTLAEALDDDHRRVEAGLRRAYYHEVTSSYAESITEARQAIEIARQAQDALQETTGMLQWGRALRLKGEYELAQQHLEQALILAKRAQSPRLEADVHLNLGLVLILRGEFLTAATYCEQALSFYRATNDRPGESKSLNNLFVICYQKGDLPGAMDYNTQALKICREIGDRKQENDLLNNLGVICLLQSNYLGAIQCWEQALRLSREIGHRQIESVTLNNLSQAAITLGNYSEAKTHIEQAITISRDLGIRGDEASYLSSFGLLMHHCQDDQAALEFSQQAVQIAKEIGESSIEGEALTHTGHALLGLGRMDEAIPAYTQAAEIRHALGQDCLEIETRAGLVAAHLAAGAIDQALAGVEDILEYIAHNSLESAEQPLQIYLTCYQVLAAANDPRARPLIETAHQLLQARAGRLTDPDKRRSFLENVSTNRQILQAFVPRVGSR